MLNPDPGARAFASASDEEFREGAARFEADGFLVLRRQVIPKELLSECVARMDAVLSGEYDTGVAPFSWNWVPGDDERRLRRCEHPHWSDRAIRNLVTLPILGRWAAALTGARRIRVWAVQLLYKPPGGYASGNIGWHQDVTYFKHWWRGPLLTVWIALSDIRGDCGPVEFIRGSHRWEDLEGDYYETDRESQRRMLVLRSGRRWEIVPALMPRGGVSFHHMGILHGSGPNRSKEPRRSFAVHLCTEESVPNRNPTKWPEYASSFLQRLDDPESCPVLYDASSTGELAG